jgi:hypothetical protein
VGVDVEHSAERRRGLSSWLPVLISITALIDLVWLFHGRIWVTDHQSPTYSGHVKVTATTIPTLKSPTLTPTTVQIVPLPPSNIPCASGASCIPQPSFAPAP